MFKTASIRNLHTIGIQLGLLTVRRLRVRVGGQKDDGMKDNVKTKNWIKIKEIQQQTDEGWLE